MNRVWWVEIISTHRTSRYSKFTTRSANPFSPSTTFNFPPVDDERLPGVLQALRAVASETGHSVARVALAWLAQKPGVSSIILGARSKKQLDDNLAAAELTLSTTQIQKLDELSKPTLNFPADFLGIIPSFAYGGTTINGRSGPISPFVPQKDGARY